MDVVKFTGGAGLGIIVAVLAVAMVWGSRLKTKMKGRIFTLAALGALAGLWYILPPGMKTETTRKAGKAYIALLILFQAVGELRK